MRTVFAALGAVALAFALSGSGGGATAPAELVLSTNYAPLLYGDLFVVGADGQGRRNLTHSPYDDGYASVDPTGNKIAFISDRAGYRAIWVIGVDGSGLRRVTGRLPVVPNGQPFWDPSGRWLLFDAYANATPSFTVWTVPSSGGKATRVAVGYGGVWSPTGLVAATSERPVGAKSRVVVVTRSGAPRWSVTGTRPLWSPNGLLAVNHDRGLPAEIFERPGHRLRTVPGSALSWSPRGELLAHATASTLWVTDGEGHRTRVASSANGTGFQLWWTPDGKTLSYSTSTTAGAYDIATRKVRRLPGAGPWSPDGSRYAYVNLNPTELRVASPGRRGRRVAPGFVGWPAWVGSGRLVYVFSHGGEAPATLHLARADGRLAGTLGKPRGNWEAMAAWSPDGRTVAFSAGGPLCHASHCNRYYDNDIWVRSASGSPARPLTSTSAGPNNATMVDDANPVWSPDGREIAFTRTRYGENFEPQPTELWLVGAGGGAARKLAAPAVAASWSPDGRTLAFASGGAVALVGRDGSGFRSFAGLPVRQGSDVAWSPDGGRLAAIAPNGDAFTAAPDGAGRRTLGHAGTRGPAGLAWSPDGSLLAVSGDGIRVITVASGRVEKLVARPDAARPRWSPDGRRIAYSAGESVYVIAARGGRPVDIGPGPSQESDPAWRPR